MDAADTEAGSAVCGRKEGLMATRETEAVNSRRADISAMVAEQAYFKAQCRGFAPGHELDDWLAAEREVTAVGPASAAPAKPRKAPVKSAANKPK